MRLILVSAAVAASPLSAQIVCDTLPIAFDPASAVFTTSTMSFGDSVLTVNVINTSTTPMAYPQLKLVPITPLPPGMVLNTDWSVFASSWNPGETTTAEFYFDVAQPLPPDAEVTFAVWAANLTPLLIDDPCRFGQDLSFNLNPATQGLGEVGSWSVLRVHPQPAGWQVWVERPVGRAGDVLELWSAAGQRVMVIRSTSVREAIDVSALDPGGYLLVWREKEAVLGRRVVLVAR
jgi:hypothetical protein